MNIVEAQMVEILKELKKDYGVIAVKSEFETEGSRKNELTKLRDIISKSGLKMYIKIGGCEAVRDLDDCKILSADGIMAPMIETPFAASKFKNAFNKVFPSKEDGVIDKIINLETITAYNNIDDIFSENRDFLDTVVIGRSDFSASSKIPKSEVNGSKMFEYCKNIIEKANDYGFNSAFGGSISVNTIDFIKDLEDMIDRIETRKIVFDVNKLNDNYEEAISKAIEFEYLYLKNKLNYYQSVVDEDKARFDDLKNRVDVEL
ncbi:MAG: aldolase/citrate lyase family protein [Methanobacteriaceae archaeon]|nr:aldolase/citrate lyase family protein [Methanobacteriaceae archaeon]